MRLRDCGIPPSQTRYLPGAQGVACNELEVLRVLTGMPHTRDKWEAATAPRSADPPVVPLLGYFLGRHSQAAMRIAPNAVKAHPEHAVWYVQGARRCLGLPLGCRDAGC